MAEDPVLVVDDEVEMRSLLARILGDAGHAVETAGDPREALASARARAPRLVLLDLDLADDASWRLLEELRGLDPPPAVLGLGVLSALGALLRGGAGSVSGFVPRPVHAGDLLSTCRRMLAAGGARDAPAPEERRRSPRHGLRLSLELLSSAGEPLALGELVDLSASGASLRLPVPFDVGERLHFAVSREGDRTLELEGDVRWCSRDQEGYLHGVEFAALPPESRMWLDHYCAGGGVP